MTRIRPSQRYHPACCHAVLLSCALAGCAAVPLGDRPDSPLDYLAYLHDASPVERQAEWRRLEQEDLPAGSLKAAVHYGLARSFDPDCDASCASDTLVHIEKADGDADTSGEYHVFAHLLRRHLQQSIDLQQANAQAAATASENDRLATLNTQLQTQIKALTRLEQELAERELEQE